LHEAATNKEEIKQNKEKDVQKLEDDSSDGYSAASRKPKKVGRRESDMQHSSSKRVRKHEEEEEEDENSSHDGQDEEDRLHEHEEFELEKEERAREGGRAGETLVGNPLHLRL
jgi:hypothetical protein